MPTLELLRSDHLDAVLTFETVNRGYFAQSVSDRGDAYFANFSSDHLGLIDEQASGGCAFYVLVAEDGTVMGRFNLYDIRNGQARLGYRVAGAFAGRGVATSGVLELCRIAARQHGVHRLRAATSDANVASQKVLTKAEFRLVGPAEAHELGGKSGVLYERDLS